ncbi:MAG: UvrB/UvrC motif-containing protein [Akkermansia sp.]
MTELSLCEECARKRGLFDPQTLAFSEKFFPEAFKERIDKIVRELIERGEQTVSAPQAEEKDVLTHCPVCGFPLEVYRRTGRLGCPDCYTVFAREFAVAPGLSDEGDGSDADSRAALEAQLREAVAREDYETAATLRDRLRQLNEKPQA